MKNIHRVRLFQKIVDFRLQIRNVIESLENDHKALKIDLDN